MRRRAIALLTCATVLLPVPAATAYQSPEPAGGGSRDAGRQGDAPRSLVLPLLGEVLRISPEGPPPSWPSWPGPLLPPREPAPSAPDPAPTSGASGEPSAPGERRRPGEGPDGGRAPRDGGRERGDADVRMDRPLHRWSAEPGAPPPRSGWRDQRAGTFDLYEDGAGDPVGGADGAPASRRLWPVLPLGAGLVCLGLGLASLAFRLRR